MQPLPSMTCAASPGDVHLKPRSTTLTAPRKDDPLAGLKVPASKSKPPLRAGPDNLETALAEAAERLPVPEGRRSAGHRHVLPDFNSGKEAVDYARRRFAQFSRGRS